MLIVGMCAPNGLVGKTTAIVFQTVLNEQLDRLPQALAGFADGFAPAIGAGKLRTNRPVASFRSRFNDGSNFGFHTAIGVVKNKRRPEQLPPVDTGKHPLSYAPISGVHPIYVQAMGAPRRTSRVTRFPNNISRYFGGNP